MYFLFENFILVWQFTLKDLACWMLKQDKNRDHRKMYC